MKEYIKFYIYNEDPNNKLMAKATIIDGVVNSIKLLFHSPRGMYYSFINDAYMAFRSQYPNFK